MMRVCKCEHSVCVVDLLSPEDKGVAKIYNHLEQLRDPSHTVALSESQLKSAMTDAGLNVESIQSRNIEVDF